MRLLTEKMSQFADVVLRAFLRLDAGQANVAVFTLARGGEVKTLTVGGVWIGDCYSWRAASGTHTTIQATGSDEIFAGAGDENDASVAAVRLCWGLSQAAGNDGEWQLAM